MDNLTMARIARATYSATANPKEKMQAAIELMRDALDGGFPFPADVDGEQYARMAISNAEKAVKEFEVGIFAGT